MPSNIIPMRRRQLAKLECSACGATATAACNCGAPYVRAGTLAAKALAKNPDRSNRAIAKELGIGAMTVVRARKAGVPNGTVVNQKEASRSDKRIGSDGKARRLPEKPRYKAQAVSRSPATEFMPDERGAHLKNAPPGYVNLVMAWRAASVGARELFVNMMFMGPCELGGD